MVSSDVDFCSQALRLCRAGAITSLNTTTDTSNEAEICALFYDDFVEDILTRYPWTFALKKAALVATTTPVNEWQYAHTYPSEALRLWALYPSSSAGVTPINHYDVSGQPGTRVVNSNYETLYAEYTTDVSEANWPGYFSHFAIYAFASLIALPVTDDTELAERLRIAAYGGQNEGERGGKFATATGVDAQQQPANVVNNSPLIQARFS